jgi:SAM-dependent methyltransferase
MRICPLCRSNCLVPMVTRGEIAREIRIRERFVRSRFDYGPSRAELMDLTEFMHGGDGILAECAHCGLTVRLEDGSGRYEEDIYDPGLLEILYPRYLHAFRAKESQYRPLLPTRADVLEIGSHLGSFLQAAEEWGWRPRGFDIGRQTSQFARRRGLSVEREFIEDARLPAQSADATFVWNCFEQLPDPGRTIAACYGLVRRGGLLVVRTPNVAFYRNLRPANSGSGTSAIRSLAYNNLLGFPYLAGYKPNQLASFLSEHGFQPVTGFDSTLLTVPYPEIPPRLQREIEKTQSSLTLACGKDTALLSGPWMEIVCRKVD